MWKLRLRLLDYVIVFSTGLGLVWTPLASCEQTGLLKVEVSGDCGHDLSATKPSSLSEGQVDGT